MMRPQEKKMGGQTEVNEVLGRQETEQNTLVHYRKDSGHLPFLMSQKKGIVCPKSMVILHKF